VDPNSNDYSIQSQTSEVIPSDSTYVNKKFLNPNGTRSHVVGGMRSGVDSMIDDFEESILPRPGWANKKIV
jgi:hypothetical protein